MHLLNRIEEAIMEDKHQKPNTKLQTIKMFEIQNKPVYDLEDRTFSFARQSRDFVTKLTKTIPNIEYGRQLIRSSGSPAANYIEANEALSKKDFCMRIKICRKESKESMLWLKLCDPGDKPELLKIQAELIQEAIELTKIFNSIVNKSK